jgi:hypothetical protein
MPSVDLIRHFECCPQFQNDDMWGVIWIWGKEEITRTQIRRVWELRNHWNNLFGQNVFHGDGSVTGSVVVMQHPSGRMTSSSEKMSLTVWWFKFNLLPIIVTVKCRSDLTTALILVIFSSVFDMQGLPKRGSSYTISQPSKMLYATPVLSIELTFHKPILIFRKFLLRFNGVRSKIWSRNAARDFVSAIS